MCRTRSITVLREQPGVEYADLSGTLLTGFGPADRTHFDGANLYPAGRTNAVFGKPNYLVPTERT